MINISKIILVSTSILILFGCGGKGWFRDRANDYVEAQSCPVIKVPADTQPHEFSEEYQIPES